MRQILKCSYHKKYCIDHNQILQSDIDPQVLTVGCPNMPQTSTIWRTAAIWKNRKMLISSQQIDRLWQNLVRRCVSILWILIISKIWRFQKSKMAATAILKIRKIAISLQWNDDCDEIWHSYVSGPSRHRQPIKFHKFENLKWREPPSWKIEKS